MRKSVVVIGAGVAGIAAAVKLIESGFDVKILEASDRIGGRIHSVPFGSNGEKIDLGAQWVSAKNEVYDLIKDHFELGDTNLSQERKQFLTTSNEELDQEKYQKLISLGDQIWELSEEMENSEETFGEFFIRKHHEALASSEFKNIEKDIVKQMLQHHEREFNAQYSSTSWHQIKAKYFPVGDPGSETMTWKTSGYSVLFDYITKKLPDSSKQIELDDIIHLNKKVVKIDWKTEKVVVKSEDQSEFIADHVVVTIPHGILKARLESLFSPTLPAYKVNAIKELEFGAVGKVFLEFEEEVIPHDVSYYSYFWSEKDLSEIQSSDRAWLSNITGFLHVDQFPKLVEIFVAGDKMLEFETVGDEKLINDCLWLLEKLLKRPLNRPIKMQRTKWLTNENFLGSYSFHALSAQENTVENIAKPISNKDGKPFLHFAGEATDKRFMGYVNGAMNSGERAAKEIVDFYN